MDFEKSWEKISPGCLIFFMIDGLKTRGLILLGYGPPITEASGGKCSSSPNQSSIASSEGNANAKEIYKVYGIPVVLLNCVATYLYHPMLIYFPYVRHY